MRRPKMRRALQVCVGTLALAAAVVLVVPAAWYAELLIVLMGIAFASGVSAVVLWCVERPREVVIRKVRREREPRVMH